MRGQSFFENAIITGMVIGLVTTLFYFSSDFTLFHYRQQQADDALRSLLITANAVHELGPGNRQDVLVSIPEDVQISTQTKSLVAADATGTVNSSLSTPYDVVGQIPASEGISKIPVRAVNQTLVKIGHWMFLLSLQPYQINFTSLPVTIYLYGEDLDLSTHLVVDGVPRGPAVVYTVLNDTVASFLAIPTIFTTPLTAITSYQIAVANVTGRDVSNSLPLRIRGSLVP